MWEPVRAIVASLMVLATAASALAASVPSDATGCAAGSRCISVTSNGEPSSSGASVAQCRGKFPDFIVPKTTIPAGYAGPWFQPERILRRCQPSVRCLGSQSDHGNTNLNNIE